VSRPPDDGRDSIAALVGRVEEIPSPRPVGAAARSGQRACRIVATDHHDGVVFNASRFHRVEDLAGAVIHFGEHVGIQPTTRFPREVRMHAHRRVQVKEGDVREKRPTRASLPVNKPDGALGDPLVAVNLGLHVENTRRLHSLPPHALPLLRHRIAQLPKQRVGRVPGLIRGVLDPEPLIKALIYR
jgi:hypothetical protein